MEEVIRVKNLTVGYNGIPVVNKMDFGINRGEITVIIGPSGCGKTTVLKTIIGLIPALSGDIFLFGHQADFFSEKWMNAMYQRIGVLYQVGALLNSLDIYDNVSLPIKMHYPGLQKEIEMEMVQLKLSQVDLRNVWNKFPSELSEGMKKRTALARAMMLDPEVIFCDEPSAGLDPITAAGLDELILNLKNLLGITFVIVTHELRSIERIADKVIVINQGRMAFTGGMNELSVLNDPFIDRFFLKDIKNA
jgi:phospholipid/cholesterol/gamma-HCH transport system ATP-binding protein